MNRYTVPVLMAIMLVGTALASAAPDPGLLSGGAVIEDGEMGAYVYGEIGLNETLALGIDYNPKTVALSGWMGQTSGYFGEVAFAHGNSDRPATVELGLWGSTDQVSGMTLTGWLGARTQLSGSSIRLTANAEAAIPVTDLITGYVGATTTFLGDETGLKAWLGLGFYF